MLVYSSHHELSDCRGKPKWFFLLLLLHLVLLLTQWPIQCPPLSIRVPAAHCISSAAGHRGADLKHWEESGPGGVPFSSLDHFTGPHMGLFCVNKWQKCQCLKAIHLPHNSGLAHRFHLMTPEAFCLIKPLYHHYHGQQTRFMLLSVYSKCLSAFSTKAYFSDAYQMLFCVLLLNRVWNPSHKTPNSTCHPYFQILSFRIHFPNRDTGCRTFSVVGTEY